MGAFGLLSGEGAETERCRERWEKKGRGEMKG